MTSCRRSLRRGRGWKRRRARARRRDASGWEGVEGESRGSSLRVPQEPVEDARAAGSRLRRALFVISGRDALGRELVLNILPQLGQKRYYVEDVGGREHIPRASRCRKRDTSSRRSGPRPQRAHARRRCRGRGRLPRGARDEDTQRRAPRRVRGVCRSGLQRTSRDARCRRARVPSPSANARSDAGKYVKSLVFGGLDGIITTFVVAALGRRVPEHRRDPSHGIRQPDRGRALDGLRRLPQQPGGVRVHARGAQARDVGAG